MRGVPVTMLAIGLAAGLVLTGCGSKAGAEPSLDELGGNADYVVINASEPRFTSLEELLDASSLVVYGTVTGIETHRYFGVERSVEAQREEDPTRRESFDASEVVTVRVEVHEVLAGELDTPEVSFPWEAYEIVDAGLTRGRPTMQNGLLTPEIGQQYVLFLREAQNEADGAAPPTHALVSFDGLIQVVDGKLFTTLEGGGIRISEKLIGTSLDELRVEMAAPRDGASQ